MIDVLMPALSPTMESGGLAKWHVKVGDKIKPGQILAEIETDKATMEVEAIDEGVIDTILIAEGTADVAVNTPIARISAYGETPTPPASPAAAPAPVEATAPTPVETPASPAPPAAPAPEPLGAGRTASPLAARIAQAAGLPINGVTGSGPQGRIVKSDVEAALGLTRPAPVPALATDIAPSAQLPAVSRAPSPLPAALTAGSYDLIPLDGMRRTIARRMSDSFRDVPHFPLSVDIEVDALLSLREQLNARLAADGIKASLNDLIIKAAASTLRRVPQVNASYTPDGVALHHDVDIAVAVAIDGGLITPIIRKANEKGVGQIARETKDLAERARARALAPAEFQGGTFSISNLGMFGMKSFSSIVNEPQGAILSVGVAEKRPVARGDQIVVATVMSVTLTCDHRAMDGATAARWVQVFKASIEEPLRLLL
jgi:pyruvate dehydrogenase E2 component (dihydrolipoamide acetyltransferase)